MNFSKSVSVSDITGDGKMILVVEESGVRIYETKNDNFVLLQEFNVSSSENFVSGAITDDHEWVLFGSYENKTVEVYRQNGSKYRKNQTVEVAKYIKHMALTQNHEFLVLGSDEDSVFVYKHNGTKFNSFQNFTYS